MQMKSEVSAQNNRVQKLYEAYDQKPKAEKKPLIKVALFSDLHVDYEY